jgi:hypothetical protein
MKRSFRDHDYIETVDGLLFTVVGNVHPEDRIFSYLKNFPSLRGKWKRDAKRYTRPMRYYSSSNVMKTVEFLRRTNPQYVFNSNILHLSFSAVPVDRILKHYVPEEHLAKLRTLSNLDALQLKAVDLATLISHESGVAVKHFGVTGSILADLQNVKFSDIDLVVYGRSHIPRIKDALLRLFVTTRGEVRRLHGDNLARWCKEQMRTHPLSMREMRVLYSRKWNRGLFKNTIFSIHPVKVEEETNERFGDKVYLPQGTVEATARVIDSDDSYFIPGTYIIDHVVSSQQAATNVHEIVSFEGLYADIASPNELVKVRGTLEDVLDRSGKIKHQRIVVGSHRNRGSQFMKVVRLAKEN